jgi:hypothetical protein
MTYQRQLYCKRKIIVSLFTAVTALIAGTSYASWYSCPTPSDIAAGHYAPFILCSGKVEDAKTLNMVYTNAFKNSSDYWGLCKYRNPNTLADVYVKIPIHGANDVTPTADNWLAMSGQYACGFEQRAYISPDKNPQFNY